MLCSASPFDGGVPLSSLPHILVLATGGTIAGVANCPSATTGYQAAALPVDDLLDTVAPFCQHLRLEARQIAAINSKDADPMFWQLLGQAVQDAANRPEVDGIVIAHGTDTLEESAYYLHLSLKTSKPIVLTGAMRPATALSADGPMNLLKAIQVAADPLAAELGVMVVMNQCILGARDVIKRHTQQLNAFDCPNTGLLGTLQDERVRWFKQSVKSHISKEFIIPGHTLATPFTYQTPLAPVDILYAYAGLSTRWLEAVVNAGSAGLIWAGTGNGSMSANVQSTLGRAAAEGVAIVRSSRTGSGYVTPNGDCDDRQYRFIAAGTLSPQKARILLSLTLGQLDPALSLQERHIEITRAFEQF